MAQSTIANPAEIFDIQIPCKRNQGVDCFAAYIICFVEYIRKWKLRNWGALAIGNQHSYITLVRYVVIMYRITICYNYHNLQLTKFAPPKPSMTTSATSPLKVTSGRGESQGALGDAWKMHRGCMGEQRAGFDGEFILQHASNILENGCHTW